MAPIVHSQPVDRSSISRYAGVSRRIALFTGAYNHIADGVSLTLNRLVAHLERTGAEVLVFAPTVDNPPVEHAGTLVSIPSVPMPGRPEYRISLGIPAAARALLREFDPTLFHIATPDVLGYRALRLARSWDVPVVASYHTHFSSYLKYYGIGAAEKVMWKYLRSFYRQCRHIYVPSSSMADVLRAQGITEGLHLWQRGVDTALFNPSRRSLAWRRSLGIEDDEVVVSFVGRLVWEKGLGLFADVVERLQARNIPHRSLIVGHGPVYDELRSRLGETIFTGHLHGEELARAYASSDVFFFPSDTETFGNVTLEAMASGLPAVCADATGSNVLVDDGVTGLLAPAGETDRFFEHVARLVTDETYRAKLGSAAFEKAQAFEWKAILSRLVDLYDEVLVSELVPSGDGFGGHPSLAHPTRVSLSLSN